MSEKGKGDKAEEQTSFLSTRWELCPCAISSDPRPPDGQEQMSFVHSQVEMGNLHGLEKRYRKRSAFEDHPQLLRQFLKCRDHTGESCPVSTVGPRWRWSAPSSRQAMGLPGLMSQPGGHTAAEHCPEFSCLLPQDRPSLATPSLAPLQKGGREHGAESTGLSLAY